MRRRLWLLLSLLSLPALVAACEEDVLKDPTFRDWCGDGLCAWTTVEGAVRKAPTWHKDDVGVELVATPTTLTQDAPDKSPHCIQFTTLADVDPAAQVTIGMDFDLDGTIDYSQPIVATDWHEVQTVVTAPPYYSGIRFVLKKSGTGKAVLAQLRVQKIDSCTGPAIQLHDRRLGEGCDPAAAGADCQTGACCDGICAECCSSASCSDGGVCERRTDLANAGWLQSDRPTIVPNQCDPGKGTHTAGQPCIAGNDCASGVCEGAVIDVVNVYEADGGAGCSTTVGDAGAGCVVRDLQGGHCR